MTLEELIKNELLYNGNVLENGKHIESYLLKNGVEVFIKKIEKHITSLQPVEQTEVKAEPQNCSKCGRSGYSMGTPFCTDDFCNNPK